MHQPQLLDQAVTNTTVESASSISWSGPLFVVGMFRSGTSLLYTLLNQHPEIALMFEAEFFRLTPLFWGSAKSQNWIGKCDFWNQVFQRHSLDPNQFLFETADIHSNIEEIYRQYARRKGARIWGDKSPNYHDFLSRLAQECPQAKFIILWRDPLAICRSIARAGRESHWFDRIGTNHRILMGYRRMKFEFDVLVSQGAAVQQVQYEQLVKDPVETMNVICDFLGINFVPEMASLKGADRSAIYNNSLHSQVRGERVVACIERPEVLSRRLKSKIGRYVCLWRQESEGLWPVSESIPDADRRTPSFAERLSDQIWYHCLRGFDAVTTAIYFWAPRGLLKAWRTVRQRSSFATENDAHHSA